MSELTVSYLILAHESTSRVTRLADKLLKEDPTGQVIIHFDKKSGKAPYQYLKEHYISNERCHVLGNRVRCGWGQCSLVEATLRLLRYARQTQKTDYYYLLSEYCYPTQPIANLKAHLSKHYGTNFIECEDSSWIKGGIREDRYLYWHFLNKRKYPKLHRWSYKIQKFLGLKRKVPEGLNIRFGSQWWCLTDSAMLHVLKAERKYRSFFRWSWIPDESVIQTLVFSNGKLMESGRSCTYANFDENGNAEILSSIEQVDRNFFFARKCNLRTTSKSGR